MYFYSIFYPAGKSGHEENTGNPESERRDDRVRRRKIKENLHEPQTPVAMDLPPVSSGPEEDKIEVLA